MTTSPVNSAVETLSYAIIEFRSEGENKRNHKKIKYPCSMCSLRLDRENKTKKHEGFYS